MNEETIKLISEKAEETMKPYKEIQNKIDKSLISGLLKQIDQTSEVVRAISKAWTNDYNRILEPFNNLLKGIDFSKIDENTKYACEIMLKNGFYPYSKMGLSIGAITSFKSKKKIEDEICEYIENDIKVYRKKMLRIFSNYKTSIYQIYRLYKNRKYNLCVLLQINFLSQVFNQNFESKDFTQKEIETILRNKNILNNNNEKYYQFIPYIIDKNEQNQDVRKYKNTLLVNYEKKPELYSDVPYNRHAIMHGYSKKYGNKVNCLRWFSVMLNTLDLFEIYVKNLNEVR